MSIYKLYTTTVGDGAASLDIVADGRITGIQWSADFDHDADGEQLRAELSFASSSGFTTNDTKSSFSKIAHSVNGTPGFTTGAVNLFVGPVDIPVNQGERVYLHTVGTAASISSLTAYMYVDDRVRADGRRVRL